MAGKSRAGQAGYHEGRDSLGRKAWLADDKGPQKVSGKSSAQVLGDLHKDLESMSAGFDDAEIDQRYDNMLDSVADFFDGCDDSSFAEDKVVFSIDSPTRTRVINLTEAATLYSEGAEEDEKVMANVDFTVYGDDIASVANSKALRKIFDGQKDMERWGAFVDDGRVSFPAENFVDEEFAGKIEELQDLINSANMDGDILDINYYGEALYDAGDTLLPEGCTDMGVFRSDLVDSIMDDAVYEGKANWDDDQYQDKVYERVRKGLNQGTVRGTFIDMMNSGEIDPSDVEFSDGRFGSNVPHEVLVEIVSRTWEENDPGE